MSLAQQLTLTVFGATGGCAANALVAALRAGVNCVAMVRTPAKLRSILEDQYKVSAKTLDPHLIIVQGNIRSVDDIKHTLSVTGRLPDRILFGVGGSPRLQPSLLAPVTLDDPHVCEEGMKAVISALRFCAAENIPLGPSGGRPVIIAISTISMSTKRDMPYSFYPLEYWLLNIPRADKMALEKVIFAAAAESSSPLGGFAMVRPPLLTDGEAKGPNKVRAGWVWPDDQRKEKLAMGFEEAGPQIGFSITKADVGEWIFENLIQGDGPSYGKCWSLTS
jgi:hypothetical protein